MQYGNFYVTRGIAEALNSSVSFAFEVEHAIARYLSGDWGTLCTEDWEENDLAVQNGGRVLASYMTKKGTIWIITEFDRSATTILFPSEY